MKKWISTSLFLGLLYIGTAQEIPIGSWRNHISFSGVSVVVSTDNLIFAGNEAGLFMVQEGIITPLSKVNGLSRPGASSLAFDSQSQKLIVGHSSGEIDIVDENGVANINSLLSITQFANKSINAITIYENRAFLGTAFGIGVIDLESNEIIEFYSEIGNNGQVLGIRELIVSAGRILASTDSGLLLGDLETNLLDFNNWTFISPLSDFQLTTFDEVVYASWENLLFQLTSQNELDTIASANNAILDVNSDESALYVLTRNGVEQLNVNSFIPIISEDLDAASSFAVHGSEFLVADTQRGLLQLNEQSSTALIPNGPAKNEIQGIKYLDKLYAVYQNPGSAILDSTGYSDFDGVWTNVGLPVPGITDVEVFQSQTFFSTAANGFIDLDGEEIDVSGQRNDISIAAMSSNFNNLYAISPRSGNDIFQYDGETWQVFEQVGGVSAADLRLSFGGLIWIREDPAVGGIYAFSPELNSTFSFTGSADGLPSSSVRSLAIDLNDQVWIGTAEGPAFISNASFVESQTTAFQPFFEGRPFLEGESINAIAVDGGNRKWFGTDEGIWVLSESDEVIDQRFTAENSPLLSNEIREFAYDFESGEMFILTDIGLCSYQSASSQSDFFQSDVTIFPNPIRTNSQEFITIKGLDFNVNLKVTTLNGELIYETFAVGGTATWNLQTLSNEQAQGGVYLLFTSSFDGEQTFVGKVAVIR